MNQKRAAVENLLDTDVHDFEVPRFARSAGQMDLQVNKQGQKLGAKGRRTRQALMDAARALLRSCSPIDLSAVSIAKAAKVASASFYMYFDDVRDLLYQMSEIACSEYDSLLPIIDEWKSPVPDAEDAFLLVRAFNDIWTRHREILVFRNLEADHGDPRFDALWRDTLRPVVVRLGDTIQAAAPSDRPVTIGDARAQAVVLTSALERIACADPKVIASELGSRRLERAMALVITKAIGS